MKVVIVFAHPAFETSRINLALHQAIQDLPDVVWHNLYDRYPQQIIDVQHEQHLLDEADALVLQHPLYWYSCPALMKNWLDSVLTLGWAYGEGGTALRGKAFLQAISSGGPEAVYQRGGYNNFTLAELLRPFEQTADLCEMSYHQPFLTPGVRNLTEAVLVEQAEKYRDWISGIAAGQLPPTVNSQHASQADYSEFL